MFWSFAFIVDVEEREREERQKGGREIGEDTERLEREEKESDRSNLDDKTRKNIIGIMNMWVLLDYEGIIAFVADTVESFTFSCNIDFLAGVVFQLVISH
ncbi:unnamed protein product [Fraxinus pennsylvanica]|uniref:Uncharacterized protein n=1 Tax=Fraxinus pennsylvanica TaxID=56036 RepID=A0AAD1ZVS4_9LAMI|nr:unnamed protein product [Fraxinus pennsylvanica]